MWAWLTAVDAVGEEGKPIYIGSRQILFAWPPSSAGSADIHILSV